MNASTLLITLLTGGLLATTALAGDSAPAGKDMVMAIVTFQFSTPKTLDEAARTFKSTAPKYQKVRGLLRKNYWLAEDGREGGGVYVWASRADADALYTPDWKKFVEGKYGMPPGIRFVHTPVMVDNLAGRIISNDDP